MVNELNNSKKKELLSGFACGVRPHLASPCPGEHLCCWSSMIWWLKRPGTISIDQCVCQDDELSGDGDEGDFGKFAVVSQAPIEVAQCRVVPGSGEGGEVEDIAYTLCRPPLMRRCPRRSPLSSGMGARPVSKAICLSEAVPSSGRQATSRAALTGPIPGMERRIWDRRAKAGWLAIRSVISASRLSISLSMRLMRRCR